MSKERYDRKSLMITGASSSGKSTIAKIIRESERIERLPGHTTRTKRPGEFDGFDFIYLGSNEEFLQNFGNGLYVDPNLDVTMYMDNYYGSPRSWITRVNKGLEPVVFTPTSTVTAKLIKDLRRGKAFWLHLFADEAERIQRLREKGISGAESVYRISHGDSQGQNPNSDLNIDTGRTEISDIVALIRAKIR